MARVLQDPWDLDHNVRVYDNDGTILASLQVNSDRIYVTYQMLYRYCSMIFIIPSQQTWSLFSLLQNGTLGGYVPREDSQTLVAPGNYIVLDHQNRTPITIQLTPERAPRRVTTWDRSTQSQGQRERDRLQSQFRRSVSARDTACAITNAVPTFSTPTNPYGGLQASHIFPTSQLVEWNRANYRRYITDPSPANQIGDSGLYSPQNGLFLDAAVHQMFDEFLLGVDPDAGYQIICFSADPRELGGERLRSSARNGTNPNNRVSADLLRWHLRMCVYRSMKGNAEPRSSWEEDLGSDDVGQILEQPDAGERMEVELFTRLGELVA
ncbi:uncharacterized protein N7498_004398 [Penicillium cinerascens]|uniref:HNH nuclease domain-containing protein n=1 Tax=Penicillium cinerascens TaxID=70096 RepID=A0A9W9N407_9EURO|nr:uncharacterized protein N7498_004398 [Penicillium cinerascens]KAJ5212752.1 hypothetical protein N7498_004398 [Penicillium cinerascens]